MTVGAASVKLLERPDEKQSVVDTTREMLKGYIDSLIEAAREGERVVGKETPFYVCVQTRRDRLMVNLIRNQFYWRYTRPTPQYDLAVYLYDPKQEKLEFVWCVPDKETVLHLYEHGSDYIQDSQLVHFCRSFVNGTLI